MHQAAWLCALVPSAGAVITSLFRRESRARRIRASQRKAQFLIEALNLEIRYSQFIHEHLQTGPHQTGSLDNIWLSEISLLKSPSAPLEETCRSDKVLTHEHPPLPEGSQSASEFFHASNVPLVGYEARDNLDWHGSKHRKEPDGQQPN